MPDREKVIKGLECCKTIHPDCEQCPYFDTDAERIGRALCKAAGRPDDDLDFFCTASLHADVLELLKEQEPRVMTLEEVQTWAASDPELRDPIFYEDSVLGRGWWITHDNDCVYLPSVNEGYGRCWTSRPTDEQRKATPWEPPKEG